MKTLLLAAAGLLAASCGGLGPSAYCDFRSGTDKRCQERVGTLSAETFKATCRALPNAVAGDGTCPRDGVVGGCQIGTQGDGSKVNDWYYQPTTVADAQQKCASEPGTYLNP